MQVGVAAFCEYASHQESSTPALRRLRTMLLTASRVPRDPPKRPVGGLWAVDLHRLVYPIDGHDLAMHRSNELLHRRVVSEGDGDLPSQLPR